MDKKFCKNHPEKKAVSFCHSCGEYYCSGCLNEGKEYYYCSKPECYKKYLIEKPEVNKKWSASTKVFWIVVTLCILFNFNKYENIVRGISYGIGYGIGLGLVFSWIVSI